MSDMTIAADGVSAPKLDDLMLAMDVVDTLRHDQRLVERELLADASDEVLINRLREIYKGQGIEVPERVLEEGVKALKEKRFTYEPPRPSLARSLAFFWIVRARIGKILLGICLALLAVWLAYDVFVTRPQRLAQQKAATEFTEVLPKTLADDYADVGREAKTGAATEYAARLLADGKAALARGDAEGARKAVADMEILLGDLRAEFMLRIVNRPGEASGVWREPMVNTKARNDYLIVEAVAPGGKILSRPILNEETGITSTVNKWGVRVSNDVFQKVIQDKRDNGIIDNNTVGQKKRGALDIEYIMPVLGGTITKW